MKKLIFLIMVMLFLMPGVVFAGEFLDYVNDEVIAKLDLKQGVAYSLIDHKINYLSTAKVAELIEDDKLILELGYAGSRNNTGHKIVGVVSYNILELKKYTDIPVLDLINFRAGLAGGYGRLTGSNEWDCLATLTLISFKK